MDEKSKAEEVLHNVILALNKNMKIQEGPITEENVVATIETLVGMTATFERQVKLLKAVVKEFS